MEYYDDPEEHYGMRSFIYCRSYLVKADYIYGRYLLLVFGIFSVVQLLDLVFVFEFPSHKSRHISR